MMILHMYLCVSTSGASLVAQKVESACDPETQVRFLGQGEGNGNPLQYSCLENLVHGVAKSRTRLRTSLSSFFSINTSAYVLRMSGLHISPRVFLIFLCILNLYHSSQFYLL